MAEAPICMTCNLERTLVSIKPGRNRHHVHQYECPACRDIFTLVSRRAPVEGSDAVFKTARQA
jgi:hypothetical protein